MKPTASPTGILLQRPRSRAKIILAILANQSMTMPELIVAAWCSDNELFGIRGYHRSYPCSNRVAVEVSCLIRRGLVRRVGKLVRLVKS